jgi:N-acetylglucosaminyldiphosphoundecaprenol N-acetyl-beta-D-mannosaminyltransferase
VKRIELFGCPVDVLTMGETVEWITRRIDMRQFTQHVVVNVAKLVNAQTDALLAASVRACDIINIDGMGVVWGARVLGHDVRERVAGVDLFAKLLEVAAHRGFPVFLLGAKAEIVDEVARRSVQSHPELKIAGFHHGYFWDDEREIVEKIRGSGARMLFVAITSPKKENFINRWRDELGVDFVMGVGGTFDVVAGKVRRAPLWVQRAGMEWLFRVAQEPKRMAKRYFVTNSKFSVMLTRAWLMHVLSQFKKIS